ncbi:MAG: VanW family protein [Eubacteriales bacterium]|nr:VanW family protein [Eubacteriales bacterium]
MALHEKKSASHARHEAETTRSAPRRRHTEEEPRRSASRKNSDRAERELFEEEPVRKRRSSSPKSRNKRRRKAKKRLQALLILLVSLALALVCGALYAGSCVSTSETNLPNVYVDGIDVSGLSKEETEARLKAEGWDRDSAAPLIVSLPAGQSFELDRLEAGAAMSLKQAVDAAFAYGHTGNWLGDLRSWLSARLSPVDRGEFVATLDDTYIAAQVDAGLNAFAEATAGTDEYFVNKETETLDIVKGAGQLTLDRGKLTETVRQALLAGEAAVRYDTLENPPQVPDFPAIHQVLEAEPQDAHFVEGGWDVVEEVVGCRFDVGEAERLWSQADWMETVQVPLDITYPAVTGESLRSMLFRDLLGTQTTYFPNSIQNRISNIQLAASKLDGVVLNPGEIFSYNETVGERTEAAGFLMAAAYSNGEVVEELGGGVCQVSSTLYCAVLYSQLGIKSRDNHYFKVDYLDWGMDATVSWPSPDFKFQNTRDYPVKIHTTVDPLERYITIEIWGTDTDGTHIELYNDRYRVTDDTYGVLVGWNVYLYAKIIDAEGNVLRVEERAPSTYHLHDEDIAWPPEKYAAG